METISNHLNSESPSQLILYIMEIETSKELLSHLISTKNFAMKKVFSKL
jgi:hypothetical protein